MKKNILRSHYVYFKNYKYDSYLLKPDINPLNKWSDFETE